MPEKTKNLTVVKRDVNRNTSNQIISYGLPKSKEEQYGSVRLISAATFYEKESYKKVMGVVSDELINNNGELEITEQKLNYIKYKASSAEIVSELEEFVDIFSGRYEMTDNATTPSGRQTARILPINKTGKNRHLINPTEGALESITNQKNYGKTDANLFRFSGYEQVPFDKTSEGPALDNGRYVITKELIDSGRSLKFKFTLGAQNNLSSPVGTFAMRLFRRRLPWNGGKGVKESTALVKTIPANSYPILTLEYILKNEDMVEFDTWEPKAFVSTGNINFDISGEKSIFEVDLLEPENVDSEIQRTSPPFTVNTWNGNIIINPDTGVLTVTKGNSTTTPTVSTGIGNKLWPEIFQPTPIVDKFGLEDKTQKPTAVAIGNITVPDGYNNKGAKIKLYKTIDVYRTPTYFSNLEATIKPILNSAKTAASLAATNVFNAEGYVQTRQRIYDNTPKRRGNKRADNRKERDRARNSLTAVRRIQSKRNNELNRTQSNYDNRRKSLNIKTLSTAVGTPPVVAKNDISTLKERTQNIINRINRFRTNK